MVNNKNTDTKKEHPYLPPYNKNFFYKLYFPDLIADILLIVFGVFTSNELFSDTGIFYQIESWQTLILYSAVTIIIPWYMGYIYVRNQAFYPKLFMKITLWVFILMMLMILVNLVRMVIEMDDIEDKFMQGPDGFMAVFAMFLLVMGPMCSIGGAARADEELTSEPGTLKGYDAERTATTGAFTIMLLAIAIMIYIIGLFPADSTGFLAVLCGFFGGPLGAILVFGLYMGLLKLLDKIGIYKYLKLITQHSAPFLIVAVLVFWSGVAIHFMQHDFGDGSGKISLGGMLFSVFVSGLIPFRIVMMFNAPLRLINIIIGILSLSYFFVQLILLTV